MHGQVWIGTPMVCVEDSDEVLAAYVPTGSEFGFPQTASLEPHPWQIAGLTSWHGHGVLALMWPGVEHAVCVFWEGEERRFAAWYFNLQDAPRRTAIGFDTLDHELDIVWRAGAPTWEWKDEDEFARTGESRYPGRVPQIRAEGKRITRLLDAGERWWDQRWAQWAPAKEEPLTLPAGWDELPT